MDSKRFDAWTRNRALRLSRRDALRIVGVGGAAATLPAFKSNALAQGACSLTFHAETASSVSAPAAYDGTLQFALGADGDFTQASFTTSDGGTQSATGHATGRAIDFEVTIAGSLTLAFSGVGARPIDTCSGDVAGIFTDLQSGGLGAWQGTTASSAPGSASGGGQPTSGSAPSSGGSSSSTGGAGPSTGDGDENNKCPAPQTPCGSICCPGFGACVDVDQEICACPDGAIQCGFECVQDCMDENEFMNLDTCQCEAIQEPTCTPIGVACTFPVTECCSGGHCQDDYCCYIQGETCSSDAECCFSGPNWVPRAACIDGICGQS